jgi:hypothetical protein
MIFIHSKLLNLFPSPSQGEAGWGLSLVFISCLLLVSACNREECKVVTDCDIGEICLDGQCFEAEDIDAGSDTNTNTGGDTDTDTDTDTDADTDSDGDSDTDTDVDTDSDTDTSFEICADPETDCPTPSNSCSQYTCEQEVCVLEQLDGESCDTDSDDCSEDMCMDGECESFPLSAVVCESDSNECTKDICVTGVCQHMGYQSGESCADDGDSCTQDVCDNGACGVSLTGISCDSDGNSCNDQICMAGDCTDFAVAEDESCDDGLWCNGSVDKCKSGACTPSAGSEPCAVIGDCLESECDEPGASETEGECDIALLDDVSCDDGCYCNGPDTCDEGICIHGPEPCGENSTECNTEVCNESGECDFQAVATGDPCNTQDGLLCNGVEKCDNGTCISGTPFCAAFTNCLERTCHEDGGTPFCEDAGVPAEDGTPCNTTDVCAGTGTRRCLAGICADGEAPVCLPEEKDGDLCTRYLGCVNEGQEPSCLFPVDNMGILLSVGCDAGVEYNTTAKNNEAENYNSPCNGQTFSGGEVGIFLDVGANQNYTATIDSTATTLDGQELYMILVTDPCDADGTCLEVSNTSISSTTPSSATYHYIIVDGLNGNRGVGTVSVTCP